MYREIPTYARVLALGETGAPEQVAVIGTEEEVAARLASYADVGVTDLAAMTFGVGADRSQRAANHDRTLALLADLARR
jgi:alkanesulfonate monooxygenase SsuD/methylene tetrahydromethanopterin reductase-like flavin-dependent oxidoreductase (luciferase family)